MDRQETRPDPGRGDPRRGRWASILVVFALCMAGAWIIARWLGVDFKVAMLMALILAYLPLALMLALVRRHLRRQVAALPPDERAWLAELEPEIRFSQPAPGLPSPVVTVSVGVVCVNVLIIPWMVGPLAFLHYGLGVRAPAASVAALLLGFVLAWAWWSAGVTVWRRWAMRRRGMPADEVQWRGEQASLLWPANHVLARTELGHLLSARKQP